MNDLLQKYIPSHIGRYTDEFYPTATGDNFQKLGHNTILIEAGHFKNDYDREITRKFNFYAILKGLFFIAINDEYLSYQAYTKIPNNDKKFLDIIYSKIKIIEGNSSHFEDVGIQIKFKVVDDKLISFNHIENRGDLTGYYTFNNINAENIDITDLKLSNS